MNSQGGGACVSRRLSCGHQQPVATLSFTKEAAEVASQAPPLMDRAISSGSRPVVDQAKQEAPARYPPTQNHCLNKRPALIRVPYGLVDMWPIYIITMINILAIFVTERPVEAVDCFKCLSRNGSNKECEDPFNNLNTTRITSPFLPETPPNVMYHAPCYAGRKNRDGLFPASACIKIIGTFEGSGETLVVRHCALDSGTLTQDTELARMSHCGRFIFEGETLKGCVLACPEDACNWAGTQMVSWASKLTVLAASLAVAQLHLR